MAKNEKEDPFDRPDHWILEDVYPSAQDIFTAYPPPDLTETSVVVALDITFAPQPKFNGDPLLIKRERCLVTDAPYRHFSSCHLGEG